MDNFLDNGTVLPSGLLSSGDMDLMAGFNKTYRNSAMRMGIVTKIYPIGDSNNQSKLSTEYEVTVFEQHEDKGSTIIVYRNCLSNDSLGSIADYFERNLRVRKNITAPGNLIDTKGQNGALVLVLCLDSMSDKAIIIGGMTHPDRQTNLVNDQPYLQGEYNGVNVKIANDGSVSLTFKGATDNYGTPTDSTQGNTVAQIETDGSVQINHSQATLRLDKDGTITITSSGDTNINCANATVTASQTATVDGSSVLLGAAAAEAVVKGNTFQSLYNAHTHSTAVGPSGPPVSPLPASALSKKVKTE